MTARRTTPDTPLTARQAAFVREYLVDLNGADAVRRAGYSHVGAKAEASRLLARPNIAAAIAAAMAERAQRVSISADAVLTRLWAIATADPNELSQLRRVCCRHCHGIGHAYQWRDAAEFARAAALAKRRRQPEPDDAGGYGYQPKAPPHPGCPECNGDGEADVHLADTRGLTGAARALYAGAKATRDGLEVKMHDQMRALELVGKHLGLFRDKVEVTGANGGPIEVDDVRARIAGRLARLAPPG